MDLPIADAAQEDLAKYIFRNYLTMRPDEWAARFAHRLVLSSFADNRYDDPGLHDWIHELHRLLLTPGAVEHARQRYLRPSERARIAQEKADF